MLKDLPGKAVNNVHLVCRNLHQIANLHVNPKLRFWEYTSQELNLESLIRSSRIFRKLEFFETEEETEMLKEFIKFTGPQIKKFFIKHMKVDQKFFQLLNFLPNLEALELDHVEINYPSEGPIKWALKSSKIKRILINYCPAENFESLLEFLEKCVIEEAVLGYPSSA